MNTTTIATEMYQTAKGMNRFRGECPACGAKFSGKFYAIQVQKAYAAHECKA